MPAQQPVPFSPGDPTWRATERRVEVLGRDDLWRDGILFAWRRRPDVDPPGWQGWCEWTADDGRLGRGWIHQGRLRPA